MSSDATSKDEETPEDEPKEMQCELALLDKRYDSDGHKVYRKRKDRDDDGSKNWWKLYALTETRHYHENGTFKCTRLHVNPQPLKQLLEDVVKDFPYDPVDAQQEVEFDLPAHCLFFHREKLEEVGNERFKEDETSRAHLKLLLDWIDKVHEESFKASRRFHSSDQRPISYEYLWTAFRPGCLVYTKLMGQPRAYKLRGFWYESDDDPCLAIRVQYIDYDGEKFGTRKDLFRIPKYSGVMRCEDLNIMPLDYHSGGEALRARLLERGRKFRDLTGTNFRQYSGVALKRNGAKFDRYNITGRVVVDCKNYQRFEPDDDFELEDLPRTEAAKRQRTLRRYNEGIDTSDEEIFDELTEDDLLMTNATVRGFAWSIKKFVEFFVENLSPTKWDDSCFDQLVLDPTMKRTVQAMVTTHSRRGQDGPGIDDIVEGKGKGLVMVLHGPPGVGKTLTAECVAESVNRPLYMVSAGDLGTDSYYLETKLARIMDIATTWGAVLLIDEADVFLERRSLRDLHRNAMVTIFLRVLEYYRGILFLTTNRVATFDDAFTSRIHVPLRYTNLSEPSRRQIWRNFCNRVPGGVNITEKELDLLAKPELNGRQIKNIVKAAESLAAFDGRKLDAAALRSFTKVQGEFERDWMGFVDVAE
ncbi:P-loop containing nucleoside triphosphate hydrolase protein [Annulohypoxylon maeteangense]|uniref:P-loop containing nucleoside triphosphate hydrolase protein n=1 Tax=Annulohypoxylon maeteangense TaxID=1927788 RepID=UPI002007C201|nr:P-loop containing nucleoside triphosphate hydrolase protein [Annulohypoxylon maeteangense]KAI0884380.1 P-loop containing nucleoside triphosphate hydrolase protein [Annulohypoxylon maeteangense]